MMMMDVDDNDTDDNDADDNDIIYVTDICNIYKGMSSRSRCGKS